MLNHTEKKLKWNSFWSTTS